jgi:hypothetical protein
VAQAVRALLNKCEALSSNPCEATKQNKINEPEINSNVQQLMDG